MILYHFVFPGVYNCLYIFCPVCSAEVLLGGLWCFMQLNILWNLSKCILTLFHFKIWFLPFYLFRFLFKVLLLVKHSVLQLGLLCLLRFPVLFIICFPFIFFCVISTCQLNLLLWQFQFWFQSLFFCSLCVFEYLALFFCRYCFDILIFISAFNSIFLWTFK